MLIENDELADDITEGGQIEVEVGKNITYKGKEYQIAALPQNLLDIINAGGLVKAMRKLNGLD